MSTPPPQAPVGYSGSPSWPGPWQPLPYPIDALQVMCAMRLGWAMSELRGRFRPGSKLISVTPQSGRLRGDHALPLGGERTVVEQLIEAEAVVSSLAGRLEVDVDVNQLVDEDEKSGVLTSQRLAVLAKTLSGARKNGGSEEQQAKAWDDLADFLYLWDAKIQDELAGDAFSVSSAYQLGRGLGDIAWLDPGQTAPDVATSWSFVLGELRVATLKRLVFRLADYFQPHSGSAVGYSLTIWQQAAADTGVREQPSTREDLVLQTKRWRDLLLTGLDPTTLLPRNRILGRLRQVRTLLHAFWPEILIGAVFAVLIALGVAWLITSKHPWLATFASVFGAIGLTTSALLAKAKDEAQNLVGHLRAVLDADLLKAAVTVSPFPEEPWWHFW
jgi:hypothetical protein